MSANCQFCGAEILEDSFPLPQFACDSIIIGREIDRSWGCSQIILLNARLAKLERVREAAEDLRDAPPIGTAGWLKACDALTEALADLEAPDA